jgi:hypothetical protein
MGAPTGWRRIQHFNPSDPRTARGAIRAAELDHIADAKAQPRCGWHARHDHWPAILNQKHVCDRKQVLTHP